MRGQPRLRRRRAARADQLPELRQPREAARRLAADRGGRRAGRRLRALGIPVVGGNVSLYNEAPSGPIFPTPVVGMVGELPDARARRPARVRARGRRDRAGRPVRAVAERVGAGASCGAAPRSGRCRRCDAQACPRGARRRSATRVRAGALRSAHDIAEGGLAVALAECCLAGGLGAPRSCLPDAAAIRSARRRAGVHRLRRRETRSQRIAVVIGRVGGGASSRSTELARLSQFPSCATRAAGGLRCVGVRGSPRC